MIQGKYGAYIIVEVDRRGTRIESRQAKGQVVPS
jgi:hypothetical protein